MSQIFILNASFHLLLNKIDQELAEQVRRLGCTFCRGNLHLADYPRSPLGIPPQFRESYESRLSFCCDNCRRRTTPQTVRFFGRRWIPAPFLILISTLMLGINERRLAQIKRDFGVTVSESSLKRWRKWWRESFEATPFWQQARGLIALPTANNIVFPRVLLDLYQGTLQEQILLLLRFLSPLTAGVLRAV